MSVDVNVFSNAHCNGLSSSHYHNKINGEFEFCAGHIQNGKDSCSGDSGGPLQCIKNNKQVLYGIVSSGGSRCGVADQPGIYSKVVNAIPWIRQHVKDICIESDSATTTTTSITDQSTTDYITMEGTGSGNCRPSFFLESCEQFFCSIENRIFRIFFLTNPKKSTQLKLGP